MFREFEEKAKKARTAQQPTPAPTIGAGGRNPMSGPIVLPPLRPAPAPALQSSIKRIHNLLATMWGSVSIGVSFSNISTEVMEKVFRKTDLVGYEQRLAGLVKQVSFLNGIFLACTQTGLYTSPDGYNWTQRQSGIVKVLFEKGVFVAIGVAGTFTSTDGIAWTHSWSDGSVYDVVYSADLGMFVKTTFHSQGVYTSLDGTNWTQRQSGIFFKVVFGNGVFVAAGTSGVYSSTDGITWKQTSTDSINDICFGNGMFMTTSISTAKTYRSTNGITWTETLSTGTLRFHLAIGRIVMFNPSINSIHYTINGDSWTTIEAANIITQIFGTDDLFVVKNELDTAFTTDFKTWTIVPDDYIITLLTVPRSELNV